MRIWAVLLISFLACCSAEHHGVAPATSDYFPLRTGAWFTYDVDSTVTNQGTAVPWHYELRVMVTDSFPDSSGELLWVLQRSKRADASSAWQAMTTWSARMTADRAIISEGNILYVKIAGPLHEGNAWNGNEMNSIEGNEHCPGTSVSTCDVYELTDLGKPYQVGAMDFNESLRVIQSNVTDSTFFRDVRSEVYARGKGLVARSILQLQYCYTPDCFGLQQIDKGIDYRQTLTGYGGF